MNGNTLSYYENKLDIIIYLLNSSDNENVKLYLIDEYNKCYSKYEKLRMKEVVKNAENNTHTTVDWV